MSVTPSPIGGFAAQFFDNNGQPLSGGKIYTYAAGTTTPQATYTSAIGVTPHANPIVLDSAGRVPSGEIWLTDGLVYKFVIETAAAILIGTYDNISGINSNFVNYTVQQEVQTATAGQTVFNLTTINYTPNTNSLSVYVDGVNQYVGDSYLETDINTVTFTSGLYLGAEVKFTTSVQATSNATDASLVSYEPPFAGSTATNVENKLAQYVSVKDFGAVCDGAADDAAEIQAAIDYVKNNGGGTVTANGTSLVSTPVVVPVGVTFLFNVLKPTTSSNSVLTIYGGCTVRGKVDVSAFAAYSGNAVVIDGNGENVGSPFRLHIQTDVDVVVNASGFTGTAVYFKAVDTIARIMNVKLQADINRFQYGVRMEQTSTDLSKFITSNTIEISASETLIGLAMASSQANNYGLDGNNILAKCQPKIGTTDVMFDLCGQDNIFDLIPWDWDGVVGTAPKAVTLQAFSRRNVMTLRTDWAYMDNLSTDPDGNIFIVLSGSGPRFPSLYTARTDNLLPVVGANLRVDNNRYFTARNAGGSDFPLMGLNASNDLIIQSTTDAGSDIIMDTRNATGFYAFRINSTNRFFITPTHVSPGSDNTQALGTVSARWSVVYAATGTINTSDARLKQDAEELDAAEKRVALALKALIRKFRYKDAVEAKGDEARVHVGVLAQEVEAAFAAEGLDARRYGLLCYDETEDGGVYGIRYDELMMFILGAL